jgi:hypothetical protein
MTGKILTRLFALFGMTLTCVACYGVEYTEYNPRFSATGRVIDELGTAIEGIKVNTNSSECYTDNDGRFFIRGEIPTVEFTDVDGAENGGEFEQQSIDLNCNDATLNGVDLGDIMLKHKQ